MDQNQLLELLTNLRSPDNEARKAAEAQYESVSQANPGWMMHALAEICATSNDTGAVTLVLILLRKLFNMTQEYQPDTATPVFLHTPVETQEAVKGRLLQVLSSAAFGPQRGSAAACVGALVVAMNKGKQQWDELWRSVFEILGAAESPVELKTICCDIIAIVSSSMTTFLTENRAFIAQGMHHCLTADGPDTKALKESAFKVVITLAPLGFKDDFAPLVPDMLNSIQSCLNAGNWDAAEKLLISLVQGLSEAPQLFESQGTPLLAGLMQVASSAAVAKEARHAAVEGLLTFCEEMPKAARKVAKFADSFFELLYQYTLTPEFADDWDTSTDVEAEANELEEATDFLIGCSGLSRLADAIGGRKLKDTAIRLFSEGSQSPDWKYRHAAVSMICYITEGMQAALAAQMGHLVTHIIPFIRDEVKYVRSVTLDCLAQLSQDFAPDIQSAHHADILPPAIAALRDPVPHVASAAARCLDSFFDSVVSDDMEEEDAEDSEEARMLAPYAQQVCQDCVALLNAAPNPAIALSALGALSSVISTVKVHMTPYTAALVPVFQGVLSQPDSADMMDCKCKAIECVTLLAAGVGKATMGHAAMEICEFLKGLCQQGLKNDDPRFRYVLRGWTCMVECLKEDALPYVDGVMPMLINLMDLDCDIVITEAPVGDDQDDDANREAEEAAGIESLRIVIPGVGERIAKMHTSLIEDKELASNVMNAIMMELGTNLLPYFPAIARSAIKLLDFKVNDSIRESGGLLLTSIMEAYEELQSPDGQALAAEALNPLLDALAEEPEADVTATLMECVSHCISSCPAIITADNVALISEKLNGTLQVMVTKRKALVAKLAVEKDEDEVDNLESQDETLRSNLHSTTDLVGTLLQRASAVFAPIFSAKFFPLVAEWLQPQEDDYFVNRALAIICDFVEYAPQQVASVLPTLLSSSLAFATSRTDEDVLQADYYLINNLVQYLGTPANNTSGINGADYAAQSQQAIANYLATPQAATENYLAATANAASVYVSLLQYFHASLGAQKTTAMLQTLVAVLPCEDDDTESRRVHDRVLAWITSHHAIVEANPGVAQALIARLRAAKPENISEAAKQQLAAM